MIKKNFLTGEYVIFSPDRENRPKHFSSLDIFETPKEKCPFCLENAYMTFEPIYSVFEEEIRILENKYPILTKDKNLYGIHQVIIDTKEHDKRIQEYTDEHIFYVMKAIKEKIDLLYNDCKIRYVQVFKNEGINAGASQSHSHWQILGISILPNKQSKIVQAFKQYENEKGKCYLCDIDCSKNMVLENKYFFAFCPEDSLFSYEVDIIPKDHITSFRYLGDEELMYIGKILKDSIYKLSTFHNNLNYNICLYSGLRKEDEHHFFIQIIPRLGNLAGFEFSTGMYVNSILPNIAAKNLREI